MRRSVALLATTLSVASGVALAAQLYRWVDEKGNVEWRDTPPPATAKKVEERRIGGLAPSSVELPYSLQLAVKNFPVTLWVTDCGDACNKARAHLARRGVPHQEKDPRADFENFQKLTGGTEVPVLFVGSTRLRGYLEGDWDSALDTAGYPRTALVKPQPGIQPKPPAEKSAPADKGAAAPPAPPASAAAATAVRLYTTADCGFNCTDAKRILAARGVNFQEISVDAPPQIEELQKLTGNTIVPVLHLGSFWLQGYSPVDYEAALDKAGYKLPAAQ
jgi:glutaredoxin